MWTPTCAFFSPGTAAHSLCRIISWSCRPTNPPSTLRASLSGTFLQRKDVVNHCLEFALLRVQSARSTKQLWDAAQMHPQELLRTSPVVKLASKSVRALRAKEVQCISRLTHAVFFPRQMVSRPDRQRPVVFTGTKVCHGPLSRATTTPAHQPSTPTPPVLPTGTPLTLVTRTQFEIKNKSTYIFLMI